MLAIKTNDKENNSYVDQTQDIGNIDYVKNNTIYKNNPCKAVLISNEQDLTKLSEYPPGTMAYTAGFRSLWQLSISREWISVQGV